MRKMTQVLLQLIMVLGVTISVQGRDAPPNGINGPNLRQEAESALTETNRTESELDGMSVTNLRKNIEVLRQNQREGDFFVVSETDTRPEQQPLESNQEQISIPRDLQPPTTADQFHRYTNHADKRPMSKDSEDKHEDMDTASTIFIGRHSGRFFGPGIWVPPFRPYRYSIYHRPRRPWLSRWGSGYSPYYYG